MMTLKNRLKRLLGLQPKGVTADHFYGIPVDEDIRVENPNIVMQHTPPHHGGRIVSVSKHQDYSPDIKRMGGRVVKVMPRELQQIKKAQEKLTDDNSPQDSLPVM